MTFETKITKILSTEGDLPINIASLLISAKSAKWLQSNKESIFSVYSLPFDLDPKVINFLSAEEDIPNKLSGQYKQFCQAVAKKSMIRDFLYDLDPKSN